MRERLFSSRQLQRDDQWRALLAQHKEFDAGKAIVPAKQFGCKRAVEGACVRWSFTPEIAVGQIRCRVAATNKDSHRAFLPVQGPLANRLTGSDGIDLHLITAAFWKCPLCLHDTTVRIGATMAIRSRTDFVFESWGLAPQPSATADGKGTLPRVRNFGIRAQ